jgi:hypothetical protein
MATKVVSSIVTSNGLVQSGTTIDSTAAGQALIRDGGALGFRALVSTDISGGLATVTDTATIDLTLAAGALSGVVRTQMSITSDAAGLKLSGDAAAPGNGFYYGTDNAGVKGFFILPRATTEAIWRFDATSTTMADPGLGKVRIDNASASLATALALSKTTDPGTDMTAFLRSLVSGDSLSVQDQDNSANWVRYTINAAPVNNTTWWQLPLMFVSGSGTAVANNARLLFVFGQAGGGAAAGGGTTILSGAIPPTPSDGVAGNYYEDTTNGVLYGPKSASGWGAEQIIAVSGSPGSSVSAAQRGVRVRFARGGRVKGVRYQRLAASGGTLTFRAWKDATTTLATQVDDTQSTTGVFTVNFSAPVAVAADETWTFTYGASGASTPTPYFAGVKAVSNTADCTFLEYRFTNTNPNYPASVDPGNSFFVEPIYEPNDAWPVAVRFDRDLTDIAALAPSNDDILQRKSGAWSNRTPAQLKTDLAITQSDVSGTVAIASLPLLNGFTDTDVALADRLPLYDASANANRDTRVDYLLGLARTQPGGRLTLASGDPVPLTDMSGPVYYTPYLHDVILLFDGTRWVMTQFAETALAALPVTNNVNYDIFGFLSGSVLALESLAWTDGTNRATAVTVQDGRYCKSGDRTRLYLGTVRVAAGAVVDDVTRRFVFNAYNRVQRKFKKLESATSWTYTTAVFRPFNNSLLNRVEAVFGLSGDLAHLVVATLSQSDVVGTRVVGLGVDSTSVNTYDVAGSATLASFIIPQSHTFYPVVAGYHYFQALESGAGSGTQTWYGNNQYGIAGWMWG